MAQPYAGYGYGSAPQQPGAWPPYGGGYGATAAAPQQGGYDYSAYYQQSAAYASDPAYAGWYAQQQQQPQAQPYAQQQQPPAQPPLPPEAPPPLPEGPPPPGDPHDPNAEQQQQQQQLHYQQHYQQQQQHYQQQQQQQQQYNGPPHAQQQYSATVLTPTGSYSVVYNAQPQQQPQDQQQQGAYAPTTYSYLGQQQQQQQYGSALPPSANPLHTQVSGPPSAGANPSPMAAAAAPVGGGLGPVTYDYSRMPPPACLAAPAPSSSGAGRSAPLMIGAAAGAGAPPAGGSGASPSPLDAMRAAAAAVAKQLSAGGAGAGAATAPAPAPSVAPVAGRAGGAQQQQQESRELPSSLQQYVARALSLLGRSNETRLELRTMLRDTIQAHRKAGTLWSTDWDREPLPSLSSGGGGIGSGRAGAASGGGGRAAGSSVWDRLGAAGDGGGGGAASAAARRKRGRGGGGDDGSSDGEDGGWGAGRRRHRLDVGGGRKGHQQQLGKHGKRGKHGNKWFAADDDARSPGEQARHAARSARFASASAAARQRAAYGWDDDSAADAAAAAGGFIVGTSASLEKRYLRLTRAPLPEEVRPQPVLEVALRRLLGMVESKADKYLYYNDQFKAMRQDLTVQGIKNDFTVKVYEAHARAALEYGDNAEYNQCQTQLAILYAAGLPGCHAEFGAYRLLYQSVHAAAGEGRRLLGTMRQLLGNKVGDVAGSPEVQHAMQVRQALAAADTCRFFRLYLSAPRLGRCLMDVAVKPLRWKALNVLVRSHKPTPLPLAFLAASLGFVMPSAAAGGAAAAAAAPGLQGLQMQLEALTVDGQGRLLPGCSERGCAGDNPPAADDGEGLAACLAWCKRHGALFDDESDPASSSLLTKDCWQQLFVPEDTSKVAHGDVNLDIRDFLAL